jgi:hypothetical protein
MASDLPGFFVDRLENVVYEIRKLGFEDKDKSDQDHQNEYQLNSTDTVLFT